MTGHKVQRHRRMTAHFILAMLLYGRHGSVVWLEPWKCTITTGVWANSIRVQGYVIRKHMEWLKKHGFFTDLHIGHGFITVTLKPVDRPLNGPFGEAVA